MQLNGSPLLLRPWLHDSKLPDSAAMFAACELPAALLPSPIASRSSCVAAIAVSLCLITLLAIGPYCLTLFALPLSNAHQVQGIDLTFLGTDAQYNLHSRLARLPIDARYNLGTHWEH